MRPAFRRALAATVAALTLAVTDNPHARPGGRRAWPFSPRPVLEFFAHAAWPDAVAGAAPAAPRPVR
jgi:hypothetical protein